jgi:DNA-binding XRE family transcriptional regulator
MPAAAQYKALIQQQTHPQLLALWSGIVQGNTPGWAPGKAFEYLVLRAFELENAEVEYPFAVQLPNGINEQLDGTIYAKGISAIIECKDSNSSKNFEPIAKLRSQLARRPAATIGMIFSRSGYTQPAMALALFLSPQTILTWECNEIQAALTKQKMIAAMELKYRKAVEMGMPDFNVVASGAI